MEDQFRLIYDSCNPTIPYGLVKEKLLDLIGPVKMATANVELSLFDATDDPMTLKSEGLSPDTMKAVNLIHKLINDNSYISASLCARLLTTN